MAPIRESGVDWAARERVLLEDPSSDAVASLGHGFWADVGRAVQCTPADCAGQPRLYHALASALRCVALAAAPRPAAASAPLKTVGSPAADTLDDVMLVTQEFLQLDPTFHASADSVGGMAPAAHGDSSVVAARLAVLAGATAAMTALSNAFHAASWGGSTRALRPSQSQAHSYAQALSRWYVEAPALIAELVDVGLDAERDGGTDRSGRSSDGVGVDGAAGVVAEALKCVASLAAQVSSRPVTHLFVYDSLLRRGTLTAVAKAVRASPDRGRGRRTQRTRTVVALHALAAILHPIGNTPAELAHFPLWRLCDKAPDELRSDDDELGSTGAARAISDIQLNQSSQVKVMGLIRAAVANELDSSGAVDDLARELTMELQAAQDGTRSANTSLSVALRVAFRVAQSSDETAAAIVGEAHFESALRGFLESQAATESHSPKRGAGGSSGGGSTWLTIGLALSLSSVLVRRGHLTPLVCASIVASSAALLRESDDVRVACAAAGVLAAALAGALPSGRPSPRAATVAETRETIGIPGCGGEWCLPAGYATDAVAGERGSAAASASSAATAEMCDSRTIAALARVLTFRESAASPAPSGDRVEGVELGLWSVGMLDGAVWLVSRAVCGSTLAPGIPPDVRQTMLERAALYKLWLPLLDQLHRGGAGELSPASTAAAVAAVSSLIRHVDARGGAATLLQRSVDAHVIPICAIMLSPAHLRALLAWPPSLGGGAAGAGSLAERLCDLISNVFDAGDGGTGDGDSAGAAAGADEAFMAVQQAAYKSGLVASLVTVLRAITAAAASGEAASRGARSPAATRDESSGSASPLATPRGRSTPRLEAPGEGDVSVPPNTESIVALLSRLVLLSPHFAKQFVACDGLAALKACHVLHPTAAPDRACLDSLALVSQLARLSADYYADIERADLLLGVRPLLYHSSGAVRAKACHLLGNLCRHSDHFYSALRASLPPLPPAFTAAVAQRRLPDPTRTPSDDDDRNDLLYHLVQTCRDEDPVARKFACFAVGNACFHSAALYKALAPAVPALMQLLGDDHEKTRANAAGALGNLVRNSGVLCGRLVRAGVVRELLGVAAGDPVVSPRRIALFSLGNLVVYSACREALQTMDPPLSRRLERITSEARDSTMTKYAARVLHKLRQPAVDARSSRRRGDA